MLHAITEALLKFIHATTQGSYIRYLYICCEHRKTFEQTRKIGMQRSSGRIVTARLIKNEESKQM